jgi:hypothetical protein
VRSTHFRFQTTLERQSEFVSRSFGRLALEDLPVYIATSLHDDCVVRDAVLDILAAITCKRGFRQVAKVVRASELFCAASTTRRAPSALDLIALWPLQAGGDDGRANKYRLAWSV